MLRYAPKLSRYLIDNLRLLFEHHPGLEHNFSNSIFPGASFNLGPIVVTDEHANLHNLVHGLCGVTSLEENNCPGGALDPHHHCGQISHAAGMGAPPRWTMKVMPDGSPESGEDALTSLTPHDALPRRTVPRCPI
jgi:hypothetical protein